MEWIRKGNNVDADRLVRITGANKTLINILLNRGFSSTDIQQILLYPNKCLLDANTLTNALKAAEKIKHFIDNYEDDGMIVIFADYDTDGITSGYIMGQVLSELFGNVFIYYPNRTEGYGLNMEFCKKVVNKEFEHKLVITVDNGTTAVNEIEYLTNNGVDVIVTDHHTPKEILPNCLIVNPHVHNDTRFKHLAGC